MAPVQKICAKCGSPYLNPKGQALGLMRCKPCARKHSRFIGAASRAAKRALKAGIITKTPCQICGSEKSEAHHDDYSKPLTVRWLCRPHHRQHHYREWSKQA